MFSFPIASFFSSAVEYADITVEGQALLSQAYAATMSQSFSSTGYSPKAGDLLIHCHTCTETFSGVDMTATINGAPLTQLADLYAADSNYTNMYVGYKVLDSADVAHGQVDWSGYNAGSGHSFVSSIHFISNFDATSPIDISAVTGTGSNTSNPTFGAIDPITNKSRVLAFVGSSHSGGSSNVYATPSDLTGFLTSANNNTTYDATLGVGSYQYAESSGPFTPENWTITSDSASNSHAWVLVAIRPKIAIPNEGVISVVGFDSGVAVGNSSIVLSYSDNLGYSATSGDVAIALHSYNRSTNPDMSVSGFTEISELYANSSLYDNNLYAGYRVLDGTETTLTFPGPSLSSIGHAAILMIFRGVNTSTILAGSVVNQTNIDVIAPPFPSISPTKTGSAVLVVRGSTFGGVNGGFSQGGELSNFISVNAAVGSNDDTLGAGWYEWLGGGAFTPTQWTHPDGAGEVGDSSNCMLIPLNPS